MMYPLRWPLLSGFLLAILFSFSVKAISPTPDFVNDKLPIGIWRGVLTRPDGRTIVFNFETIQIKGVFVINIVNGTERLLVDSIRFSNDSLFINMPFFDSHFALRIVSRQLLTGSWIKNYGSRQVAISFMAMYDEPKRFTAYRPPVFDISGRWSVHFKGEKDSTESVGEFKQTGSHVTGTFLTTTGDYRFLEGVVTGDTLKLSTFDGGHAYSFESKILNANKMSDGFYYAGAYSVETWVAERNEKAKLPDEFSQTILKNASDAELHFKFPDLNGHTVSIHDSAFKNKVIIIQILGSWCPNCMDETRFLSPWYDENKSRGVAVIGLAYERTTSLADAKRLLQPFINRFHVSYPILATGVAVDDTLRTEKTIPEIKNIVGFPTTIFIDKKGFVRKIDTGFNGPGTGEHYEMYKREFNNLVNELLNEKN